MNTVSAIKAGASIIHGTFTGIGERAGNANLGNVLNILKKDGIIFDQINYGLIPDIENKILEYAKRGPAAPFSEEAFYHESGIHAHAIHNGSARAYCAFDPELLGHKHRIIFGKQSGVSNFAYYLGDLFPHEKLSEFRDKLKPIAARTNRSYFFENAMKLLKLDEKSPDVAKRILEVSHSKTSVKTR
jgi:benzylmalate synthase